MPLSLENKHYAVILAIQRKNKTRFARVYDVADSLEDAKAKFHKAIKEFGHIETAKKPIIKDDYFRSSRNFSKGSWTEISIIPIPGHVKERYLIDLLPF